MIAITIDHANGKATLAQSTTIKAGGGVPVTLTFLASPGDNPGIEITLSPQTAAAPVVAYLDSFARQNSTTFTGTLDGSDSRLLDLLAGKAQQTLDCEVVVTVGDALPVGYPNLPVTVQTPKITGPASGEGGPYYLTAATGDARYLRSSQSLAEIAGAGPASQSAARVNLGILGALLTTSTLLSQEATIDSDVIDFDITDYGLEAAPALVLSLGITKPSDGAANVGIVNVRAVNSTTLRAFLTAEPSEAGYIATVLFLP